jgi:hypothetical protein
MEESGVHPPAAPKAEIATWDSQDQNPNDMYYSFVDDMAQNERDGVGQESQPYAGHIQTDDDPHLLQEQDKVRAANPVYPDSAGPDYKTTPPVWANEDIISEIKTLKDRLFELENKLASDLGGGQKWAEKPNKAVVTQTTPNPLSERLLSLRDEIEKVSSELGIEHEPSPWVVKGSRR